MSGQANMDCDRQTLGAVEAGSAPTLRFFRFNCPTITYGRLQPLPQPHAIQRPTGGGIVFHDNDLCLSLCWPNGLAPLPTKPSDQYRWIHSLILGALRPIAALRMTACCDIPKSTVPFERKECFHEPVGYDLLEGPVKRLGGALYRTRSATLYQGSIQLPLNADDEARLQTALTNALTA